MKRISSWIIAILLLSSTPSYAQLITSRSRTITSPSVTTSSVQIIEANRYRRGFSIWNNSSNSAYISFGTTASSATPTAIIPTFQTFQMFTGVVWTGEISAIRNSGSGTLTVTEIW